MAWLSGLTGSVLHGGVVQATPEQRDNYEEDDKQSSGTIIEIFREV
jgi:hypothetical protein